MLGRFTDIGQAVDFAFMFILAISVILLAGITVLMITFVVKYRKSRHPVPAQVESHAFLEVIWTVIPTLLALGMFYYGWVGFRLMNRPPADSMEVTAIGRMWSWQYEYENGKQSNELYVPVGRPVKVNIESRDVLHSFYVPAFRVKRDAVPGVEGFVWFEPKEIGSYDIFCAEYCGQLHSSMLSKLHVVPEQEFYEWVEKDVVLVEQLDADASDEERIAHLRRTGERLSQVKGCNACHSTDGTRGVGPTYKGLFGRTEKVVTDGETRQLVVDEEYIRRSILHPGADVVEGFQPLMPSQEGLLKDEEIEALIEWMKAIE